MKKRIIVLLLAVVMIMAMTACNGGTSAAGDGATVTPAASDDSEGSIDTAEPVTVAFWNGWTGPDGELLKELVDQYNEENTDNVTIEMDIMEFSSLGEKLATALASGTNPQLHLGFATGEYAITGQYISIDSIFDMTDLNKTDFDSDILANCYYNGELYGLPFQISSEYLFWNKDLFEQAGLDPESPPQTWEELLSYSAQIDELGGNIIGGGFGYNDSIVYGCVAEGYGGLVVSGDATSYSAVLTDSQYLDGNIQALELIKQFADQSQSNTYADGYEASFLAGTCGMMCAGSWELAGCKENNINYGISLLPAGPEGRYQAAWPISMCVMKGTEGSLLDGAYSFMEYWNNNLTNSIMDKSPAFQWTLNQGYQPYLLSVANDEQLTSDPDYQVTSSYIDYYQNYYPSSFWNAYALGSEVLSPMMENVVFDSLSVEDALSQAQTELEDMIADMVETEQK